MKTISIKLPEELNTKVERLAALLKNTKSMVVRLAIQELFRKKQPEESFSAFSLLEPYCGILKDLPADLSSAKDRMKGYGAK